MMAGEVLARKFGRVAPSGEQFGTGFRSKVRTAGIESPPFALDNDPWLLTGTHELGRGLLLRDSGDGLRPFGQAGGKRLNSPWQKWLTSSWADAVV